MDYVHINKYQGLVGGRASDSHSTSTKLESKHKLKAAATRDFMEKTHQVLKKYVCYYLLKVFSNL